MFVVLEASKKEVRGGGGFISLLRGDVSRIHELNSTAPGMQREESGELADSLHRAIVATAVNGIVLIDRNGAIRSVNNATERLFGYAAAELIGQNVKVLMPEPYASEHDAYLANYLRTGRKKGNGGNHPLPILARGSRQSWPTACVSHL
jgi:PAS domain S-box-containing protein